MSGHGARPLAGGRWELRVWAPAATDVAVELDGPAAGRRDPDHRGDGWCTWTLDDVEHGQRYWIVLDGNHRPDPASRWQPDGLQGPSALVDPSTFSWTDHGWSGPAGLRDQVLYELHVGTFTEAGTFAGVEAHLDELASLGVTAVELMPIAQFPGERNWGYDGVLPSATQDSYGGPEGLANLVDAAHRVGLAIVLDVVYNHFGPEGNHLREFGPYFTGAYATPWGEAINLSEAGSDEVRALFVESAVGWVRDFHVDGFRLDAVHAIVDPTAKPFLEELTDAVHAAGEESGRRVLVVAESSSNDPRLVRPAARGGLGMDGVWHDEVHHALRVAVTGDRAGYYADYTGVPDLARALERNVVHDGTYSVVRGRRHGRPAPDVEPFRYVVFDQNHDQVGNRAFGERLDTLVDPGPRRLAAMVVALGPFTPMLFMGEEYGETAPFPYFVSHHDPGLIEAVRRGRREEFAAFEWDQEPPDPASEETFRSAILDRSRPDPDLRALWAELLAARRTHPVLHDPRAVHTTQCVQDVVVHHRRTDRGAAVLVWNLGSEPRAVEVPHGVWRREVSTAGATGERGDGGLDVEPWEGVLLVG